MIRMGAGDAQLLACDLFEAIKVDAFSTTRTDHAIGSVAGEFGGLHADLDRLQAEEMGVIELAIGEHLLLTLVFNFGVEFAGEVARGFESDDADAFASREVDKGGGHLAPIAKLEGSLAEAAAGDHADGVGGAAIDFHEGDEALAVGAERVVDAEILEAEEGHTDPEYLASAHVPVGGLGALEEGVEGIDHFITIAWDRAKPQVVCSVRMPSRIAGFTSGWPEGRCIQHST